MKVLIDIDGVLGDTLALWLAYNRSETGIDARLQDITHWAMADCPVYAGVDPTVLHKPLKTRAFWDSIAPMPGAVAFLEHLARMGIPYNLVTAPANGTSAGAKYDWVKTHFPDALSKLVITSDKASVRGTVLIDDRDKNVVEFFRDNPEARLAIVPRNPYQDESLLDPFPVVYTSRVPNWNGILRVLESER